MCLRTTRIVDLANSHIAAGDPVAVALSKAVAVVPCAPASRRMANIILTSQLRRELAERQSMHAEGNPCQ
jgi:hypothetical protein